MRRRFVGVVLAGLALMASGSVAGAQISSVTVEDAMLSPGGTVITVRGTVTCAPGDFLYSVQVGVFQGRGQNQESASGYAYQGYQPCSGTPQSWEVEALSNTGAFKAARAVVRATAYIYCASCPGGTDQQSTDRVMTLHY